ncbi:uncharacterized protein [Rutidosis leptorrhynchoides]|uniref:uncharacterized protein isoform X2 n=1 Tax=Rutidosis leptorrhynchoides TaxID=125765 RepID=UPI003A99E9C7
MTASNVNNYYIPENLEGKCDYWLAILENHVLHTAFTRTTSVPRLHLESLFWSIRFVDEVPAQDEEATRAVSAAYFEFRLHKINETFRITLNDFKTLLNLPIELENCVNLPSQSEMMNAIRDLGYDGELGISVRDFSKRNLDTRWYVIYSIFNRCFLMTPRGSNFITTVMLKTFYAFVMGAHVDYGKLLWEMVQQQVEKPKPDPTEVKYIPCERFFSIMVEHALSVCRHQNVQVPDLSEHPQVLLSKVKLYMPKRPITADSVKIPFHLVRLVPTTDNRIKRYFLEIGVDLRAPLQQPTVEPTRRSIRLRGVGSSSTARRVLKRKRPGHSRRTIRTPSYTLTDDPESPYQPLKKTKTVTPPPPPPPETRTVNMSQTNVNEKPASKLSFQELEEMYIARALAIEGIDELRETAVDILQKAHKKYPKTTCKMISPSADDVAPRVDSRKMPTPAGNCSKENAEDSIISPEIHVVSPEVGPTLLLDGNAIEAQSVDQVVRGIGDADDVASKSSHTSGVSAGEIQDQQNDDMAMDDAVIVSEKIVEFQDQQHDDMDNDVAMDDTIIVSEKIGEVQDQQHDDDVEGKVSWVETEVPEVNTSHQQDADVASHGEFGQTGPPHVDETLAIIPDTQHAIVSGSETSPNDVAPRVDSGETLTPAGDCCKENAEDHNCADVLQNKTEVDQSNEPTVNEMTVDDTTVNKPTVNELIVSEPTVDEPTVNESTVDEMTVDDTTVNEPTVNEPTVIEPAVIEITVDEPTVNEPTVNEVDDTTVNEPTVNEPTADEPTADEPTVDEATVNEPNLNEATVNEPNVNEPTVNETTVHEPTVNRPTVIEPTFNEPNVSEPSVNEPTANEQTVNEQTVNELS